MVNSQLIMFFAFLLVSFDLFAFSSAQCDQRKSGGRLLCCKGTDNSCYVRYHPTAKNSVSTGQTKVCYCDEYCRTTGDCCPDLKDIEAECRGLNHSFLCLLLYLFTHILDDRHLFLISENLASNLW